MNHPSHFKFAATVASLALGVACAVSVARADAVTEWNEYTGDAIKATAMSPALQGRAAAIVHAAIYDAVNGIARTYTPYFVTERAPHGARPEAAAILAGYTTLKSLFPTRSATLDAHLTESLAKIPGFSGNSISIVRGRAWGERVANLILAWRATDGLSTPTPGYFGGTDPGVWRSIANGANADGTQAAIVPQMATLVPFAMTSHDQFRPGPPPGLTSALYAEGFNEVKLIGRVDSAIRTADQTELAKLWQNTGAAEENNVARQVISPQNSLVQNARIFALINLVAADAIIVGFDSKYAYNLWRPHHAIRLADTDGNPDTEADPNWSALILSPRHQEYISNHAVFTGGMMHALGALVGDEHTFTLSSVDYPTFTWTFHRVSDVTQQAKEARIWAGIHYRNSCNVGATLGMALADYVLQNFLLPLDDDEQGDNEDEQ